MIFLIEALIVLSILYFIYTSAVKNHIPKQLGLAVLLAVFLILPATVKMIVIVIGLLYFIITKTFKESVKYDNTTTI